MSRIRSRQSESESVPTRVLRGDAVSTPKVQRWAVREAKEKWPGTGVKVRQGDLSPEVVELIEEKVGGEVGPAAGLPSLITLYASGVLIPPGGAFVEFTVIREEPRRLRFDGTNVPTDEVTIDLDGTYMVTPSLRWDRWRRGGEVAVWRNDVIALGRPVDPLWRSTVGRKFNASAMAGFDLGDKVRLWVDHLDDEPHLLKDATFQIGLVEGSAESTWDPSFPPFDPDTEAIIFVTGGLSASGIACHDGNGAQRWHVPRPPDDDGSHPTNNGVVQLPDGRVVYVARNGHVYEIEDMADGTIVKRYDDPNTSTATDPVITWGMTYMDGPGLLLKSFGPHNDPPAFQAIDPDTWQLVWSGQAPVTTGAGNMRVPPVVAGDQFIFGADQYDAMVRGQVGGGFSTLQVFGLGSDNPGHPGWSRVDPEVDVLVGYNGTAQEWRFYDVATGALANVGDLPYEEGTGSRRYARFSRRARAAFTTNLKFEADGTVTVRPQSITGTRHNINPSENRLYWVEGSATTSGRLAAVDVDSGEIVLDVNPANRPFADTCPTIVQVQP